MTLIGKIFTTLIFVMSAIFMTCAVMVYATHKNWRDEVKGGDGKPGLAQQLDQQTKEAQRLSAELQALLTKLEFERAARSYALAALQTKASSLDAELIALQARNAKNVEERDQKATLYENTQDTNAKLVKEVETLWANIKTAQADRDKQFSEMILLSDKVQQSLNEQDRLNERNKQLAEQVAKATAVLTANGLDSNTPVDNVPPKLDGMITAIGEKDLVEISLGKDDGLNIGNTLDVFRGDTYIGRIQIEETSPDRAVGRILREYRQDLIKKGDYVSTKLG